MKTLCAAGFVMVAGFGSWACGDNTAEPASGFGPPRNVLAQSVSASSVGLTWEPPAGTSDTLVAGYIITYGLVRDSVPGTVYAHIAGNLLPGSETFSMQAVSREGEYSSVTNKFWAPASRYDSVFVLYEYDVSQVLRYSAFNIGSRTDAPTPVPIVLAAQVPFDAYLVGQGGQQLSLKGGQVYNAAFDPFLFAERGDAAPSLDLYIDQFPSTYTRPEVLLRDNTIYYGRGIGNGTDMHYVRIHVRLGPGAYPNRTVIISLSVQKVPQLQYALGPPGPACRDRKGVLEPVS
jgi:hypothetical protein